MIAAFRRKIAAFSLGIGVLVAGCAGGGPTPAQTSSDNIATAGLARQATSPIQISPYVATAYHEKYLAQLTGSTSGAFAISRDGNRFAFRFCGHPDCRLSDDEIAIRALANCDLGAPPGAAGQRCVIFDRNGKIAQPYHIWTDADFDAPAATPPALAIADPKLLTGRYSAMTPDGQMVISLRPDGTAYFWDTGDFFHQGTWSLRDGRVCVDSVDQRATVTCGTLYGADPRHIIGVGLDLFPGKFLPITRLAATAQ